MSKQIAVLMCAINLDNQKKILEGMIDAAKETDSNLYVFTNYVGARESEENVRGAYHIMQLPDFKCFDAAILAMNTINHVSSAEYVLDELLDSQIPTVSIDREMEGMSNILSSSYDAECEIVEHFITEHNCREIAYLRGTIKSREAEIRYKAYCDILEKHNIEYREDWVEVGYFNLEQAYSIVKEMFSRDEKPKGIVCANDAMAVGAVRALNELGYRVPEDIIVAGFDNGELTRLNTPTLTTVDKNQYEVGRRAVFEALARIEGKEKETIEVPCKVVYRASCGCNMDSMMDIEELKKRYVEQQVTTLRMSDTVRNMMSDFSGLKHPDEVIELLKKHIVQVGLESFYLCMCERDEVFALPQTNMGSDIDLMQVNMDYTKKIELPLAYEDGEFRTYKPFKKGLVLPKECRERSGGNFFVITPLFFQHCCYGYCISRNSRVALESSLYYSWLMNIGVALENIRKWMLLEDTVVRLNNIWSYDMLTQLHNRAGFFYEAKTILEILKYENSKVFLLFFDVDGLKKINDTLGHETGDLLIQEMAASIRENLSEDMLAMRYGGDEFVLFGSYEKKEEIDRLLDAIGQSIDRRNRSKRNPFTISTSIGVSEYMAQEIKELSELIEIADKDMYEQKRRKKALLKKDADNK